MDAKEHDRLLAWLRLTRLRGVGPILVKRLLEKLRSPEAILSAHPANLAVVEGIGTIKANQVVASVAGTLEEAKRELGRVMERGWKLLTLEDEGYPPGLKAIGDPPLVLYVRGEIVPQDAVAVGMVGARRCTLYGREQAQKLACGLAEHGMTIVSGGARGIDTCSHLGALQSGGRTIVVTGCGLGHIYPPENEGLYERIVQEGRGAVISELPLEAPPNAENFPPRNRIIAGMSLGIVVVEANLQSGSLITARLAAADYGREVFALPGRVDSPASAGTHHLIKTAAAHLVENAEDVLEHLGDTGRILQQIGATQRAEERRAKEEAVEAGLFETVAEAGVALQEAKPKAALTSVQEKIVGVLGEKGASVDEIVEGSGLPAQVVMAELTLLQIQGKLQRLGGNRFGLK